MPDYGRAALGIGGSGGQGVLLARHDGTASAISADGEANRAYYGRQDATPDAIMSGRVTADHPETASLKQALA